MSGASATSGGSPDSSTSSCSRSPSGSSSTSVPPSIVPPARSCHQSSDSPEPTRKHDRVHHPVAGAAAPDARVLEERDVGAGRPLLVGVEEVVDGRVVLVDRLLDEPQPQHAAVVLDVGRRVAGDARHVVDPLELHARSMTECAWLPSTTAGSCIEERPDPVPGDGELLVRIRAAGMNGADLGQRAGRYPPPPGVDRRAGARVRRRDRGRPPRDGAAPGRRPRRARRRRRAARARRARRLGLAGGGRLRRGVRDRARRALHAGRAAGGRAAARERRRGRRRRRRGAARRSPRARR